MKQRTIMLLKILSHSLEANQNIQWQFPHCGRHLDPLIMHLQPPDTYPHPNGPHR